MPPCPPSPRGGGGPSRTRSRNSPPPRQGGARPPSDRGGDGGAYAMPPCPSSTRHRPSRSVPCPRLIAPSLSPEAPRPRPRRFLGAERALLTAVHAGGIIPRIPSPEHAWFCPSPLRRAPRPTPISVCTSTSRFA